jgi:quercetin dioxygenase-like cupin family protein
VVFTIDDQSVEAHAGQIAVVPAGAAHAFEGASDAPSGRSASIRPRPWKQKWLE